MSILSIRSENDLKLEDEIEEVMTAEEFSYYLASIKNVLGYTKKKMASVLGYKVETYSNYESGVTLPKNWERDWNVLQNEVKEFLKEKRNIPDFIETINDDLAKEIESMHNNGRNVVYIGTRLDIDESTVYNFLSSKGYEPIKFSPIWG